MDEEIRGTMNSMHRSAWLVVFILVPQFAFAHPGNTAADGCHYCRTNCDKCGVPWNERHCHNEKPVVAAPVKKAVTSIKSKSSTSKKSVSSKIDECSAAGLLKVYKDRKTKGEKMDARATKSWWKKCPEKVRKEVFKKI